MTVHLKPSRWLTVILSLAHGVAASLLWPLALSFVIKFVCVVLIVISLSYYLRKDALLSASNAVTVLKLSNDMQCTFTTRAGDSIPCAIQGDTFVTPYLTVLNLRPAGHWLKRSVVIVPDNIDAEAFRQLRVLLRWKWRDNQ